MPLNYNQLTLAFEILKLLAEQERTRSELGELITNFLEEKGQSTGDMNQKLTRTIRKLRDCGFNISSAPHHPYRLEESNFPLILSNQQKEALYLASYLLSQLGFVTQAEQLGRLYQFSPDYQPTNLKVDFSPPVDYSSEKISNTISELQKRIKKQCRYTIRYYSQSMDRETMYDLDRSELRLHNGVLYLFAFVPDWKSKRFDYSQNIEQNVLFHINRIRNVGSSSFTHWFCHDFPTLTIKYRMTDALANYEPRRIHEKVIERIPKKYVDIETVEDYLFWFRQRILQYGKNAQVLEPLWLREELRVESQEIYQNYLKLV